MKRKFDHILWIGAASAVGALSFSTFGQGASFAMPSVTNVSTFVVQMTNAWSITVSPTNLEPRVDSPITTNEVDLIAAGPVETNLPKVVETAVEKKASAPAKAEASTGTTATNAPAVVAPVVVDTNMLRTAAMDAVADAVRTMRAQAATNEAAIARRRIDTRTFRLEHASAEEVAERFNATWSGDFGLNWKLGKMAQAFPEANTVMVTAPGAILDACEAVVQAVDIEPRQVYIEARFVELGNTAMHKLGIDWSMLEGMSGSASFGGGLESHKLGKSVTEYTRTIGTGSSDTSSYKLGSGAGNYHGDGDISYFRGTLNFSDMRLVLSALERDNDTRVFSNPKIIVSSGKRAVVDMTEKYPNVAISAKRTLNGNSESLDLDMKMAAIPGEDKMMFAKEAFFSWGISLEVTPRISSDGLINVSIVPTISSKKGEVTAGSDSTTSEGATYSSKYPILDVQRLVTDFAMSAGTTAVIGGLSRTTEEQVDSGIPWLRDWPWVGNKLFGSKTRQKVQKEILVFVTVGLADPTNLQKNVGVPKNAVLGKQYVDDIRHEPGDRTRAIEGISSLDLRTLEEQAADPQRTNKTDQVEGGFQLPFTKKWW